MNIVVKPLITEKSMADVSHGKYTFLVSKGAKKNAIKQAVHQQFAVTVVHVSTVTMKGRTKRVGAKRQEVSSPDWKKATVTVKKGEKIALFEPGEAQS